jgi:hypothetical protein
MASDLPQTPPLSSSGQPSVPPIPPVLGVPKQLIVDGKLITDISPEFLEWLVHDAQERGISLAQAYKEEMEAQREIDRIMPSREELDEMIRQSGPPAYVANEPPSEYPF